MSKVIEGINEEVPKLKYERKYKTFIDMNELLDMNETLSIEEIVDKIRGKIIITHCITSPATMKEHCVLFIIAQRSKRCEWALDAILKAISNEITEALYITMSYSDMI